MAVVSETTTRCSDCGGLIKDHSYGVKKCTCCNRIYYIEFKSPSLLNKANDLRLKNHFEEALGIYKEILAQDPNYPEANWGALLSEYGIEYINDNGKLIPTIHRPVQNYKITDDRYAITLLSNTFGSEHDEYLAKLNELEELRQQIEAKSKSLPKYDVFISCKITRSDAAGEEKTEEYKWGEQIYKRLIQRGFNVFFSPYSLPSSNGAYEPIIYSALQSAKYLIILASSIDNLNSKWIKNEWGRFLAIRKRAGAAEPKYYKLVIKSQVARDVPAELKEVSYIQYDNNKQWLKDLEASVLAVFPQYREAGYGKFNAIIDYLDISAIKRPEGRRLSPIKATSVGSATFIAPQNLYKVDYRELDADYSIEENVKTCLRLVEVQLRNGNFAQAQQELNRYISFTDRPDDLDYNILILKMLLACRATSLDNFFEERIREFSDFELFKKIISKLPAAFSNELLKPLSQYIIDSIKAGEENNSIEFYKLISNIKLELIKELNYTVLKCLPYLYKKPAQLMKFAQIAIPFVSEDNVGEYLNLCSDLAMGLCRNGLWQEAENVASGVKKTDPQNSKAALILLMTSYRARTLEELLSAIEQKNNFFEIEELIPNLYRTGITHLVNIIKPHILSLIDCGKFDTAAYWTEIIAKTDFDDREGFFESIISKCKDLPKSEKVFDIAIHTLGEERRDFFIKSALDFAAALIRDGNFSAAKKYCRELNNVDPTNMEVLNYHLYAELESFSMDNINKLQDMTIIEKMLVIRDNDYARQELLGRFINACLRYISTASVSDDDNVFNVFDKLLTYFPDLSNNNSVKRKIDQFAAKCLEIGLFERAKWYYVTLIRLDKEYHRAYWGVILADNRCKNDEELPYIPTRLDSIPEYSLAIRYAEGDEDAENYYSGMLTRQLQVKRKKKRPKIMLVAAGIIAALAVIAFIVYKLLG